MFSKVSVAVVGLMFAGVNFVNAQQQKEPLGVFISEDYFTKYVGRGLLINDESIFRPSVFLSKYGFTAGVLGDMDMTNSNDHSGTFTEWDTSLYYTAQVPGTDWLSFSLGGIYYDFPNFKFEDITEVFGWLTLTKMPLTPSVRIYRDVDDIQGTYAQFGIGHTFEKIKKWSDTCYCGFLLGASIAYGSEAYNKGYSLSDSAGFNDLTLTAGLPLTIGSWVVRPSVNYAMMLDSEIRENTVHSDNFWAGIGISTSF